MNRQCRWAERRSWSVQKSIDLETRGCIQTVKELYRWHHQFHVHLFLSGRFLILYSGSFHMHSHLCEKRLLGFRAFALFTCWGKKHSDMVNREGLWLGSIQFQFSQFGRNAFNLISYCSSQLVWWIECVRLTNWSKMGLTAIIVRRVPLLMILHLESNITAIFYYLHSSYITKCVWLLCKLLTQSNKNPSYEHNHS